MRPLALLLVLLAGCSTLPGPRDENLLIGGMVEATAAVLEAAPDRQRDELAKAEAAYARQPDRGNALRLALLLAQLQAPLRDDVRALGLLDPMAAQRPATPFASFALLLGAQVRERAKSALALAEAARREQEALRREEETRQSADEREQELVRRMNALRALENREAALVRRQAEALRAGEQREDTLRRQIERLRASERKVMEREEKLGVKSR